MPGEPAFAGAGSAPGNSTQASQLLPELFRGLDEESRISVLHVGPAFNDTITFFSNFRCRLQVIDLFAELPVPEIENTEQGLEQYFRDLLQFPAGVSFDLCLFWDSFDYLNADALAALMSALAPYLHENTRGHGYTVHNPRTAASNLQYGIQAASQISLRPRGRALPGYAPHTQNKLKELLHCFRMERTVLLSDRRLELLLRAHLPQ